MWNRVRKVIYHTLGWGCNISVTSRIHHVTTVFFFFFLFCLFLIISSTKFRYSVRSDVLRTSHTKTIQRTIQVPLQLFNLILDSHQPFLASVFQKSRAWFCCRVKAMKSSPAVIGWSRRGVRQLADEPWGTSVFLMLNPLYMAVFSSWSLNCLKRKWTGFWLFPW